MLVTLASSRAGGTNEALLRHKGAYPTTIFPTAMKEVRGPTWGMLLACHTTGGGGRSKFFRGSKFDVM